MIQTAEQVLESVRTLPKSERQKFFDLIEIERSIEISNSEETKQKNEKFRRALQWVDEHRKEYDGQFVLLDGDKMLAHSTNPKELYETARAQGIKSPFVKRIKAEVLPFGGW